MKPVKVTCPQCGSTTSVDMPTDRCLAMFRCSGCGKLIKPKEGSCCVVCDYSTQRCQVSIISIKGKEQRV